jgi:hypothetical protein
MAEEQKKGGAGIKAILKIILGFIFIALGVWAVVVWRKDLLVVIKGCIGLFAILAGAITIAIAKE